MPEDIQALLLYWQTRPKRRRGSGALENDTVEKYLFVLDGFLLYHGNSTVAAMRRGKLKLPRRAEKSVRVLSDGELFRLRQVAEGMEGWDGIVARFLVMFLPNTGLRPKEIRLAGIQDLDPQCRWLTVAHPKGEGSWAPKDNVAPILPPARQALADFLLERQTFLNGEQHPALVPYRRQGGTLDYWPEAMLRKLKGRIRRLSGVKFSLKTFRATMAQAAKDKGVGIEAVSKALRHSSTTTTERFYARLRTDKAFAELESAFQ